MEFVELGNNNELRAVVDSIWSMLVHIDTSNFLMWNDNTISNSRASSILWWLDNEIESWLTSVIIAWLKNKLKWNDSVIWWWISNEIGWWTGLVIMWWSGNKIMNGSYSTIVWWNKNIIRWNNSIVAWDNNMVVWTSSVALWSNSTVRWDNSFLWSDSSHNTELRQNDVFAIVSSWWMVVNTDTAAEWAQLTLWWSIIITDGDNDSRAVCKNWIGEWLIKAVRNDSGTGECLCTCNWQNWNSLYWEWRCEAVCKDIDMRHTPRCGTSVEIIPSTGGMCTYSGSCLEWHMVMDQIYVDADNNIHWICQTTDGSVVNCSGTNPQRGCTPSIVTPREWDEYVCLWAEPTWDGVEKWNGTLTQDTNWRYVPRRDITLGACMWRCMSGYVKDGDGCVEKGVDYYDCEWNKPTWSGYKFWSSKYTTGHIPTAWTYTGGSTLSACEWTCDTTNGYNWNGSECSVSCPDYQYWNGNACITPQSIDAEWYEYDGYYIDGAFSAGNVLHVWAAAGSATLKVTVTWCPSRSHDAWPSWAEYSQNYGSRLSIDPRSDSTYDRYDYLESYVTISWDANTTWSPRWYSVLWEHDARIVFRACSSASTKVYIEQDW